MKKSRLYLVLVLVIMLASVGTGFASPLSGEVNANLGYDWDVDAKTLEQKVASTGFKVALNDDLGSNGQVHFSAKGSFDWLGKNLSLQADQLWYSGYVGDVDYKLGRQVISWGTADGFNPTNYFAGLDLDALKSGDLSGEPLWAAQATYYAPSWSVTGVVVPFSKSQSLAGLKESIDAEMPGMSLILENAGKPTEFGKNAEFALRAETQFQGFDVQASVYSGLEPLPGLQLKMAGLQPAPVAEYRRERFVGLATAGTVGPMGVWGELTYGGPVPFEESDNPYEMILSVNKNYLQAVVGGDYTFDLGTGLLVQGQYIYRGQGDFFSIYGPQEDKKPGHYLYGRLGYDFTMDNSLDLVVIHGFQEEGGIVRPSYTHRFPNAMQLELSVLAGYGKDSTFEKLPSQVSAGLTYKF